jgi:hypothetical protein
MATRSETKMNPNTNENAHAPAQSADEELMFLCPDRDALGFVPSSR